MIDLILRQIKFFGRLFLPVLIMMAGGLIWHAGGVNDVPGAEGIFQALAGIPPFYFWTGLAVTLGGPALVVRRKLRTRGKKQAMVKE